MDPSLARRTPIEPTPWLHSLKQRNLCGARQFVAGFTLVELLVGVAVAAILMLVGVPSFSQFVEQARLESAESALLGAVQLAQSEALKRNAGVTVTSTLSGDWNSAILVQSGGDLLREQEPVAGATLSCSGGCASLVFAGDGTTTSHTFQLCSQQGSGRELTLYVTGKIKREDWNGC